MDSNNKPIGRSIPRNPNQKMSDDEINTLLEMAATQIQDNDNQDEQQQKREQARKKEEEQKKELERIQKEEKKKLEQAKKREEEQKKELERIQKEEKKKQEAKKLEEEKKKQEAKKLEEEKKKQEAKKQEEEKKKQEAKKQEEEKKKQEAKKQEEEKKKQDVKKQEEKKKQDEKTKTHKETVHKHDDNKKEKKTESTSEQTEVVNPYKDKITFGRVFEGFLELLWTIFKITVVVVIVTVISGFLLSRDMMIRGRNGARLSTAGMTVASNVVKNHSIEFAKVNSWKNGVDIKKVKLEADDGKMLIAREYLVKNKTDKWVVILHGYGETMEDVRDIAMHYSEKGYNVLLPDLRAHGESEGSFLGMGWLDRLDVINWIDVILTENPSAKIAIHGVDIGAETALMISGEPIKNNIKVVVAEGAYTSGFDIVKKEYKLRHPKLPTFPFYYMMNPVMKVWAGYSLLEADATKQVKNAKIPVLLVRGANDTYADENMTEKLDASIASTHEVYTVVNGAHGDCRYADTEGYYGKVLDYVDSHMN